MEKVQAIPLHKSKQHYALFKKQQGYTAESFTAQFRAVILKVEEIGQGEKCSTLNDGQRKYLNEEMKRKKQDSGVQISRLHLRIREKYHLTLSK